MIAGSGAFVPTVDLRLPIAQPSLASVSFSGFREYEPVGAPPVPDLRVAIESRWRDMRCAVVQPSPSVESVDLEFSATCGRAGVLPLPIYASVLHRADVSAFQRAQHCGRIADWPSVCAVTVPAGTSSIRLHLPTLVHVPGYLLRATVLHR